MNLDRHLSVLWRFRWIMAAGVVIGALLAVLAAYQVSWNGEPTFVRRGAETWSSTSSVLVTQPGFPWGRVTLPGVPLVPGGAPPPSTDTGKSGDLQFADPGRFSSLALLYSVISYSDRVRKRLPGRPSAGQIQATAVDATGQGSQFLPILRLSTTAATARGALRLNQDTLAALKGLISTEQAANKIPSGQRIELSLLDKSSAPVLMEGLPIMPSALAFLLSVIAAIAVTHILEALRPSPSASRHGDWRLARALSDDV